VQKVKQEDRAENGKGSDKPIYERLHNLHQEKMQKQVQKLMQQTQDHQGRTGSMNRGPGMKKVQSQAQFESTGSMTRAKSGQRKEIELYEDAKRRWEM